MCCGGGALGLPTRTSLLRLVCGWGCFRGASGPRAGRHLVIIHVAESPNKETSLVSTRQTVSTDHHWLLSVFAAAEKYPVLSPDSSPFQQAGTLGCAGSKPEVKEVASSSHQG